MKKSALGCCLVTGGAGWTGKELCRRLITEQTSLGVQRVVCVDLRPLEPDDIIDIPLEGGRDGPFESQILDITDRNAVFALFQHVQPDTVFHLAAVIDIRPENGLRCHPVNSEGVHILTVNLN